MEPSYRVEARWDAEAKVWYSSSNVPGLVLEAVDLKTFFELAAAFVPELLARNGAH